jgi:hypothetical protein
MSSIAMSTKSPAQSWDASPAFSNPRSPVPLFLLLDYPPTHSPSPQLSPHPLAPQLPHLYSFLQHSIAHLSPQSALNSLAAIPNVNTIMLCNICTALVTTIKEREEENKECITTYDRQLDRLAAKVLEYETSYK